MGVFLPFCKELCINVRPSTTVARLVKMIFESINFYINFENFHLEILQNEKDLNKEIEKKKGEKREDSS